MAYVITQNCCKDASCVPMCPVDCIRPVGGAGELAGTLGPSARAWPQTTCTKSVVDVFTHVSRTPG